MGKSRAFTLVEILLVVSILVILLIVIAGTINPLALVGRSLDARRKKDIGRIKVAFEEYYSDKECYPAQGIVDGLRQLGNCRSDVFLPWLNDWPCDPGGQPYIILVDQANGDCPKWFRILINLENQEDPMIPGDWYQRGSDFHVGQYGINDINYGVSSTNVDWSEYLLDPSCRWYADNHNFDECYLRSAGGEGCSGAINNACSGNNCYARNDCHLTDVCKVSCCGSACN